MNFPADLTPIFESLTLRDARHGKSRIDPADDEIHVWGILLQNDNDVVRVLRQILSKEESDRADRLLSEQDRTQRVITYGALRVVLSRYEGREPHDLRFGRTPEGKPVLLRQSGGDEPVRFNLTHSHGRALIAVAKAREVGVDLEKIRPERNVTGLATRFLSPGEQRAIEQAAAEARAETFGRYWVAREAALKAIGTGLIFPLDRTAVVLSADSKEGRLVGRLPDGAEAGCMIRFLPIETGWIAAVAAQGETWRVRARCVSEG